MSKATLYEYAIIWNPTKKQAEDGDKAKILVKPTTALADDGSKVLMTASMAIPDQYKEDLDQIDIVVRPF